MKKLALILGLMPIIVSAKSMEDVENMYQKAVGAIITLESTLDRHDCAREIEYINKECERIIEECLDLRDKSEELREKSNASITAYENLDIKYADTSKLKLKAAEYESLLPILRDKEAVIQDLVNQIMFYCSQANQWSPSLYATWEWIYDKFGLGNNDPSFVQSLDKVQRECNDTCDCAKLIYSRAWWEYWYWILYKNIDALTIKSVGDYKRKEIP